ncbi:MAG: hypothetical protein OXI67_02055 [Candidatus Poribacteria bacterium]|nr:hypothetical protein [Candidatus Poribacteria bacterium]
MCPKTICDKSNAVFQRNTVYIWRQRYREAGVMGLRHKPGKGRKPAFAPLSEEDAESELQGVVYRNPSVLPSQETRCTLSILGASVSWLNDVSIPGAERPSPPRHQL